MCGDRKWVRLAAGRTFTPLIQLKVPAGEQLMFWVTHQCKYTVCQKVIKFHSAAPNMYQRLIIWTYYYNLYYSYIFLLLLLFNNSWWQLLKRRSESVKDGAALWLACRKITLEVFTLPVETDGDERRLSWRQTEHLYLDNDNDDDDYDDDEAWGMLQSSWPSHSLWLQLLLWKSSLMLVVLSEPTDGPPGLNRLRRPRRNIWSTAGQMFRSWTLDQII